MAGHLGKSPGCFRKLRPQPARDRYYADPSFRPLFGTDRITLTLNGRQDGDMVEFEGSALQMPGIAFRAVLTWIADLTERAASGAPAFVPRLFALSSSAASECSRQSR